jgi:hypothetical protein
VADEREGFTDDLPSDTTRMLHMLHMQDAESNGSLLLPVQLGETGGRSRSMLNAAAGMPSAAHAEAREAETETESTAAAVTRRSLTHLLSLSAEGEAGVTARGRPPLSPLALRLQASSKLLVYEAVS